MISNIQVFKWKHSARVVENLVGSFNSISPYLIILLILLLNFFRFELDINEDHYMVLSKQFYEPDWIPMSFTFNESAGPRILYQYLTGFFLKHFSFELVAAFGKLFLCIAIAFPLRKIYSLLGFSNSDILLHLPILFLPRQSYVGAEKIFLSFEPKVFAYFFAFFAVYYILTDRFRLATVFLALATYFHILVGGWVMAYFLFYHLFVTKSLKSSIGLGMMYVLLMVPFLIYLSPSITENFAPVETPVDLDWIYTYFLKPHHTAIWANTDYFLKGFLISSAFCVMCLFIFNFYDHEKNQKLNSWNILIYLGTMVSVFLAYFDKNGAFVKYFPFRINGLYIFMIYLQIVFLLRYFFLKERLVVYFQFGILTLFFIVFFPKAGKHLGLDLYHYFTDNQVSTDYQDVAGYIKNNTDRGDVLLLLPKQAIPEDGHSYDMDSEIVRWTERSRFVAFHAAPVSPGTDKLYQWYQRVLAKRKIIEDYQNICSVKDSFKIDYVLADFRLNDVPCCREVHRNAHYFLYQVY